MADTTQGSTLKLSAPELKALTGWKDSVILEFLSLQSGVTNITNNINIIINNLDGIMVSTSGQQSQINVLNRALAQLQEQLSALDSLTSKVASNKRDVLGLIAGQSEQIAALLAQNSHLRSIQNAQSRTLVNVQEVLAGAE